MQMNGILTLKNEMLKHADFVSEWRKSRFRGLDISLASPLFEPPMLKTWIRARALHSHTQPYIAIYKITKIVRAL